MKPVTINTKNSISFRLAKLAGLPSYIYEGNVHDELGWYAREERENFNSCDYTNFVLKGIILFALSCAAVVLFGSMLVDFIMWLAFCFLVTFVDPGTGAQAAIVLIAGAAMFAVGVLIHRALCLLSETGDKFVALKAIKESVVDKICVKVNFKND